MNMSKVNYDVLSDYEKHLLKQYKTLVKKYNRLLIDWLNSDYSLELDEKLILLESEIEILEKRIY